jgi:multidrug resistance efflux pump
MPLASRSHRWRLGLTLLLAVGAGVVLLLWGGFLTDYLLTRDLYLTVAIVHILAEVPFLLRAL